MTEQTKKTTFGQDPVTALGGDANRRSGERTKQEGENTGGHGPE